MKRDYTTGIEKDVTFFTGTEVEHTPAFGKKTLFVVEVQPVDYIELNLRGIEHIYFGANMSFPNEGLNYSEWDRWTTMISYFLKKDYLCTLDIDVNHIEDLLESGLCEYNNFIPMISVKVPYIQQLGYNAVMKLDDKGFKTSNPGVWCHSIHDLQNRKVFTPWSKYVNDEIIK